MSSAEKIGCLLTNGPRHHPFGQLEQIDGLIESVGNCGKFQTDETGADHGDPLAFVEMSGDCIRVLDRPQAEHPADARVRNGKRSASRAQCEHEMIIFDGIAAFEQ